MTLLKGRNILLMVIVGIAMLLALAWVRGGSEDTRMITKTVELPGDAQ